MANKMSYRILHDKNTTYNRNLSTSIQGHFVLVVGAVELLTSDFDGSFGNIKDAVFREKVIERRYSVTETRSPNFTLNNK
jgi:hypothetical protein